jgi:hypothetical protein
MNKRNASATSSREEEVMNIMITIDLEKDHQYKKCIILFLSKGDHNGHGRS